MLETGKINSRQATWLMISLIVATAGLYSPAIAISTAGQDAWLSTLLATLEALLIAWLVVVLMTRFSGKTIFEVPELVLGKVTGKIIAFLYVLWIIHLESIVISEFGNFIFSSMLPGTPVVVIHVVVAIVTVYITCNGLEVLSRFNELFLPLFMFFFLLLIVLASKNMAATRLLPVFDTSLTVIMKSSAPLVTYMGQIVILAVIIPSLNKPGRVLRVAVLANLMSGFITVLNILFSLAIFGPDLAASFLYPIYNGIRIISIANFLERLEAVPVVILMVGGIIKISILHYAAVLGTAWNLRLGDYRPLVLPLGVVAVAASLLNQDVIKNAKFITEIGPFYALTFEAGLPFLLLVVALVRGQRAKRKDG